MKRKYQMISIFIILVTLLSGCSDKSTAIGKYHKLEAEELTEIGIMPYDDMKNTKSFLQVQSQEIQDFYDYFLNIEPEKSDVSNEDNTLASPDYAIFLYFKEIEYSVAVGENYILIALNEVYETIEEATENTTIHLVNEEVINEFEKMINKLIMGN